MSNFDAQNWNVTEDEHAYNIGHCQSRLFVALDPQQTIFRRVLIGARCILIMNLVLVATNIFQDFHIGQESEHQAATYHRYWDVVEDAVIRNPKSRSGQQDEEHPQTESSC